MTNPGSPPGFDAGTDLEMARALLADLETLNRCVLHLTAICELIDEATRARHQVRLSMIPESGGRTGPEVGHRPPPQGPSDGPTPWPAQDRV